MAAHGLNKINLLPKDSFEESSLGKFLGWALSSGRMIVVLTEFVVIVAFGSRFWFDQKLNDLIEEIEAKEAVVESYSAIEVQMRDIQSREEKVASFVSLGLNTPSLFAMLKKVTPADVFLSSFVTGEGQLKLEGLAGSEAGFALLLHNLGYVEELTELRLGKTVFDERSGGIKFEIIASLVKKDK